jgi:hypothetical protein
VGPPWLLALAFSLRNYPLSPEHELNIKEH